MIPTLIGTIKALILAAAINHFVDPQMMDHVASCETGATYNPRAVNGQYVGLYQLDRNNQREFYRRGYTDLFDPAQQANYAAEQFHEGSGFRNWSYCGGW